MLYIAYEYESAYGRKIRKLVTCKDEAEYRRIKRRIEEAGMEAIEFIQVLKSRTIQ